MACVSHNKTKGFFLFNSKLSNEPIAIPKSKAEARKYKNGKFTFSGRKVYEVVKTTQKETHGEFYGGKLKDLGSFSDFLSGKGYNNFKTNVVIRFYEQLLCKSLTAREYLQISENIDSYSDNLKDLLKQVLTNPVFTRQKS